MTRSAKLLETGLQQVVGYRLTKANIVAREIFFRSAGEALGLRPVEFAALSLIGDNPGGSQARLARALAVTPPNMTAIVNRLESKGWIARSSSTRDRRLQTLQLTPAGEKLRGDVTQRVQAAERAQLRLTPGEHAILLELLQKVEHSGGGAD